MVGADGGITKRVWMRQKNYRLLDNNCLRFCIFGDLYSGSTEYVVEDVEWKDIKETGWEDGEGVW